MRSSFFIVIPVSLAIISFFIVKLFTDSPPKLPTPEFLVFDVSKGKSHYGAGGGYDHFTGSKGNPTKYLKGIEAKAARCVQLLEKQRNEEAEIVSFNSKWSQEEGSEVWCDDGYPRLIQRPVEIALPGKLSKRCACFKEDELEKTGLKVYEGCDFYSKNCRP